MSARDAQGRGFYFNEAMDARGSEGPWPGEPEQVDDERSANLIGSEDALGFHHPCLDIDQAARLVPSSTPGHFHLFFDDVALSKEKYFALIDALVEAGIVSSRYSLHVRERGQSFVRPEWAKKVTP